MYKILENTRPPQNWLMPVIIITAGFVGIIFMLFYLSNAGAYLSDNPKVCVNCHIMGPQYSTWEHSSHREVAKCNDCHVPHNNIFNHYYFKAKDGLRHATIFTLRREPQVIFIKLAGIEVVQNNCIRCHSKLVENTGLLAYNKICVSNSQFSIENSKFKTQNFERLCWECHRETPHGRVNSLSSVPYARVPVPESPIPDWLKQLLKINK